MTPPIALRPAAAADLDFCRRIDHETMRWIVDALGLDEARQLAASNRPGVQRSIAMSRLLSASAPSSE